LTFAVEAAITYGVVARRNRRNRTERRMARPTSHDASNPAADPGLLVLVSLSSGPKHGYAMMADIETFSGVRVGPGTLYGALARLERERLIEPVESTDRRRPYRLTDAGGRGLRARLEGIGLLVQVGRRRLAAR
jgi:DNA-binding PadR family transcriptional regulator